MATKKHPTPKRPAVKKAAPKASEPRVAARKKATVPNKKPSAVKPAVEAVEKPKVESARKASAREDLRHRVLARTKASKPIAFSLDEVREIAKTNATKAEAEARNLKNAAKDNGTKKTDPLGKTVKPAAPHHVKPASVTDVLGFNPKRTADPTIEDENEIPEKFRRCYRLLIDLRNHVTGQLDQHTEETLKRSAKDDAGDLSSYGQHMADAGTDTFDRDFALSLVSSEQDALSEIEAAIQRIKVGTYGICEVTGKPISKERLLAVPFTRYSAEAQKQIEKNHYRTRQQAGLFGEIGDEGSKIADEESSSDE